MNVQREKQRVPLRHPLARGIDDCHALSFTTVPHLLFVFKAKKDISHKKEGREREGEDEEGREREKGREEREEGGTY